MNGDMWTRNGGDIVEYEIYMKRMIYGQERQPEGSEQVATSFPTLHGANQCVGAIFVVPLLTAIKKRLSHVLLAFNAVIFYDFTV